MKRHVIYVDTQFFPHLRSCDLVTVAAVGRQGGTIGHILQMLAERDGDLQGRDSIAIVERYCYLHFRLRRAADGREGDRIRRHSP